MSRTGMRRFSDVAGSWKIMPTPAPMCSRRSAALIDHTSLPAKDTVPAVGRCRPTSTFARVDLPQPDSPTMPTVSPARMTRSAPVSA